MPDLSTAGELADFLATQPRDRKVILQKDAEGNGFSPLAAASEEMYAAESAWSGEVIDQAIVNEDEGLQVKPILLAKKEA